jgi:TM2 domain-containing membrane protein YozV
MSSTLASVKYLNRINTNQQFDGPRKNRLYYQLLALFLGPLGIHNFYAKRYTIAEIQLSVTILTIGLAIPLVGLWAFCEIFLVSKDGKNIPMLPR